MPNFNPSHTRINIVAFVDYKPAELRTGKDWIIVYYAKNPLSNKLERQRLRVPVIKSKSERMRFAKRTVTEINRKLESGWSPYMESTANVFKPFEESCDKFLEQTRKEIADGIKREDTLRTYNSFLNMVRTYIDENNIKITFALEINKNFIMNYLDWVYYDRQNSPRTYNNHLLFLRTFCNFLIERGYLKENPTTGINKKRNQPKKRLVLSDEAKTLLAEELPKLNHGFYVMCMLTYYCMVRRTEATRLKVCDILTDKDTIQLAGDISKNRKDEFVTIQFEFKQILMQHIANANAGDFLFSDNNFRPGKNQLKPKKVSDTWDKLCRKKLGLPDEFQFYSLKDTGITDLFSHGVDVLKIRDQARHYDLKITEMYTPRSKGGDMEIKNSGVRFS